jgi:hypothetical protein
MRFVVFDTESDGLVHEATKIHVLGYTEDGKDVTTTHSYEDMRNFFTQPDVMFVCHNSVRFDMPLVNKILGLDLNYTQFVDTLALSWYLEHQEQQHNLAHWGEKLGVAKPEIEDWQNLTPEEYAHRVSEDVKINHLLWKRLERKLGVLYPKEYDKVRLIRYLSAKLDMAREQEEIGIKLDIERVEKNIANLSKQQEEKFSELKSVMPRVPVYAEYNKPKVMYKKDGSISSHGEKWLQRLQDAKLPRETKGPIKVVVDWEEPNPNSTPQVKDWLFSLGWKPKTYKFVRDKKTGDERMIEQVRKDGELCQSVRDLIEIEPDIAVLEGLTIINHRLGIFKSYADSVRDGRVYARIAGLTNTFRFRHAVPCVNLPGVDKPYGDEIRGCLVAGDDEVFVGTDMVSLEDNTKRHYMKPLDPAYVDEMSQEGFDPHLNLAQFAGAVTEQDIADYNAGIKPELKAVRKNFKAANYSCIYGVGAAKLARELNIKEKEAKTLIKAYWDRNWAIKKVSERAKVKVTGPFQWVYNPVSGFWMQLRNHKDIWSTINQSTGVYCFDTWVMICRSKFGHRVVAQFHDETVTVCKKGEEQKIMQEQKEAIRLANLKLKLNVDLDVDPQVGFNYSEIH